MAMFAEVCLRGPGADAPQLPELPLERKYWPARSAARTTDLRPQLSGRGWWPEDFGQPASDRSGQHPSRRSSRVHSDDSRRHVSSPMPTLRASISARAAVTSASIWGSRARTPWFVRPGRATSARNCASSTEARAISARAPSCRTGVFGLATARHRRHLPARNSSQLAVTIRRYDVSSRADASSLATNVGARRTPIDTRRSRSTPAAPSRLACAPPPQDRRPG